MTDEEKAIEYCGCNQPICRKGFETKDKQNCTCARKKNYLDGFAEGRKEKQTYVLDCGLVQDRINELEKENAELKERVEKLELLTEQYDKLCWELDAMLEKLEGKQ